MIIAGYRCEISWVILDRQFCFSNSFLQCKYYWIDFHGRSEVIMG